MLLRFVVSTGDWWRWQRNGATHAANRKRPTNTGDCCTKRFLALQRTLIRLHALMCGHIMANCLTIQGWWRQRAQPLIAWRHSAQRDRLHASLERNSQTIMTDPA